MSYGGGVSISYAVVMAVLSTSVVVLGILLFILCRKKPVESEETLPIKLCAQPCPLTDIDAATDYFNHRRIIGKGRLGTVYAAMSARGELVAVKRIHPGLVLSNAGFGFSSILRSLSLAQHPNIVSILGFSEGPGERIIVMEFAGMVSLDFYLQQNSEGASLLDWGRRLRIAAGAARGIEYLHEGMTPHIVHGCVKASNVIIDVKFCARVSDYGLCFLAPHEKRGVVGYVDDEYWDEGRGGSACASKESDVYGFGVMLLELLSGRRSDEGLLVEWALPLIKEMNVTDLLDPRLVIPSDMKHLLRLAKVASACVGNSRKNRPSISQVAAILSNLEMEIIFGEVEEPGEEIPVWDGLKSRKRGIMTWCNDSEDERAIQIISPSCEDKTVTDAKPDHEILRTLTCPSCGHHIELQDLNQAGIHDLPGLPAGVKFDPTDQEILEHLEAKVLSDTHKIHPLIDEFIPTLEGENGICYTHPEKLPGVSKDGLIRHFFHRPSKAYTTGTRKRRKVHTNEDGGETRWHKTGKTRPVFVGGAVKGFKKILVLYTNYGRQRKPEKTNWVMHQYHLGNNEEEKDGELVVSKVFYQTQPRQCGLSIKDSLDNGSNNQSRHGQGQGQGQGQGHGRGHDDLMMKTAALVDYYHPSFMSYDQVQVSHNRESPPQLIPNLVVQGDGSSFIRLAADASKATFRGNRDGRSADI